MFETNVEGVNSNIETLESRLMKEMFGLETEPTEITKDVIIYLI